ncbi:MAG: molecular chaperone DnaJ [Candidatus Woesearchaeota archaeon]|jgi:molecular chaperone DnaJ|nr:molecular chaperone DnaJ [Candidatus Woesearchaeota archaeon]
MTKNYYDILGIEKGASKEDIKKAYKKLAKKYHPDISKEANAETKFKEINEAAGVLLDDQKKQQYDTYGSTDGPQGFSGFGGGGGGFNPGDFGINLDDIFEQFGFGGFGGGSRRQSQKKDTRIYSEVELTLEDVYFGVKKEIKITHDVECSNCLGKGAEKSSDVETCPTCDGRGVVIETQRSILGHIRTQRTCYDCSGKGKRIKNACSKCSGSGTESKHDIIEVAIPKGIESGVTLRVSGKGNYDSQTSTYGDLYLKIYVKKDKQFEVEGPDLYMTLDINFIQAILGDEVEFKHFKKTLSLKIPSGAQPGTILRLKEKGIPHFNYGGFGDLYVKINVDIPTKSTSEQKKILGEYAKTLKDKSILNRMKGLFK